MTRKVTMVRRPQWSFHSKMGVALAVCAALVLPFWLYTQPDLVIMLAEQLWACF